jgi:hypothetical protein
VIRGRTFAGAHNLRSSLYEVSLSGQRTVDQLPDLADERALTSRPHSVPVSFSRIELGVMFSESAAAATRTATDLSALWIGTS